MKGSILAVLVLCLQGVFAASFLFNTSWESQCTSGCDFNNPLIWIPPQVPGPADTVSLTFSTVTANSYVYINNNTQVSLLNVAKSNLVLRGSTFTVTSLVLDDDSTFSAESDAHFILTYSGSTLFSGNVSFGDEASFSAVNTSAQVIFSNLVLEENAKLQAATCGFWGVVGVAATATISCSTVEVYANTNITFPLVTNVLNVYSGYYVLSAGLNAGLVAIQANASLEVHNSFNAQVQVNTSGMLYLDNIQDATFNSVFLPGSPAISGTGVVKVNSSSININGNPQAPAFNGTLVSTGTSAIAAYNFQIATISAQAGLSPSNISLSGNCTIATLVNLQSLLTVSTGAVITRVVNVTAGSVVISGTSRLYATNINSDILSTILLKDQAGLVGSESGTLVSSGIFNATDSSFVTWLFGPCNFTGYVNIGQNVSFHMITGNFAVNGSSINQVLDSNINVLAGTLNLTNGIVAGYISVKNEAKLVASNIVRGQVSVAANGTFTVIDGTATFTNSMYTQSPPIYGTGQMNIVNSWVNITGSSQESSFGGSLILVGASTAYVTKFAVESLLVAYLFDNITIDSVTLFANGFEVSGFTMFDGTVFASSDGLTVSSNNAEFTGSITVAVNSSLTTSGKLTVRGNLTNNGIVSSAGNALTVIGNYISSPNSTFVAALDSDNAAITLSSGNLTIAGNLQFTLGKQLKSRTYLVANATNGGKIVGTFNGDAAPSSSSAVRESLAVQYSADQVTLRYNLSIHDLPAWVWIVVGCGGGALLIIVAVTIGICIKRRSRRGYEVV